MSKNPRINITLNDESLEFLSVIADKENKSVSSVARSLIEEQIERKEDEYLAVLSDKRYEKSNEEDFVESEKFWKDVLSD